MLKTALTFSVAGLSLVMASAPAGAAKPDDDLKVVAEALLDGDYAGAEEQIGAMGLTDRNDPAMLINLGNAYAGMGRRADAQLAYKAALDAHNQIDLDMADGSVRSSREVALDGLRQLGVDIAGL